MCIEIFCVLMVMAHCVLNKRKIECGVLTSKLLLTHSHTKRYHVALLLIHVNNTEIQGGKSPSLCQNNSAAHIDFWQFCSIEIFSLNISWHA